MEQLSSCYFCGGALDASLAEYPIVPKSLRPDAETQGTVVLCSTCRQKLAAIVEPVVEAAKASDGERESAALDDSERGLADEPESESPPDDGIVDPASDGTLLGGANGGSPGTDADATAADPDAGTGTATDATASDAAENDTESTAETATESETGDATVSGETDADSEAQSTADREPSLTKLEYNKVMRLLQNRELPVDRAEIREVAVNAYDIEPEQFDAVIDAAVERDLLGQSNGRLVEAE
ncbi:hypothetical protein [Haloarcula salina]|uniref:Uncharacterized protein n=1 Tax=Haloarcula salina TaxID=1429914 RepID=A0AA41KI70_9EURY|nr:hypothetical protein [Haloarcula salina]MBV0901388.1 hypothetical protein [Haloarcula salina]